MPQSLGLKGKICTHWALNPHPTLIPAIEAGFVESVHSFGSEVGMEDYIRGAAGHFLHRARTADALQPRLLPGRRPLRLRPVHRLDLADRLAGQQLDRHAGPHRRFRRCAEHGRRCTRAPPCCPAWLQGRSRSARGDIAMPRGQKLVVQIVETFREHMQPAFVERWMPGSWRRRLAWNCRR